VKGEREKVELKGKTGKDEEERIHRNLDVWKRSMEFAKKVYKITVNFPNHEQFGLCSQMRRAAISIASNIAEGAARNSKREFLQFLNVAQGSASELDTQIELAKELGYIDNKIYKEILSEIKIISKQLYGLAKAVKCKK